jgi:hypothetical protein
MAKKVSSTDAILDKLNSIGSEYDNLCNAVKQQQKMMKEFNVKLEQFDAKLSSSSGGDAAGGKAVEKKKKKEKDPNEPKKPAASYFLFIQGEKGKLKVPDDLDDKDKRKWTDKKLHEMWLGNEKYKEQYQAMYKKLQAKYLVEKEAYLKTKQASNDDDESDHEPEEKEKDLSDKLKPKKTTTAAARKPRAPPKVVQEESDEDFLDNSD